MIFYPDQFVGMSKAEIKEQLEVTFEFAGERNPPDSLVDSLFEGSQKASTKAVEDINLKPTEAMANAAKRGLKLRKEHGRGGTEVGVARARDISNRKDLSPSTVKRMKSFFARHEVDLDAPAAKEGNEGYPSAGLIAWLLWGGDPGKTWAESKVEAIDRESGKKNLKSGDNCGTGAGGFKEGNVCATGSSASENAANLPNNLQEFWDQVRDSNEWRGMPVVEGGDLWSDSEGLAGKHEVDDSTREQAFQAASEMQVEDVNLYTGVGFRRSQKYARDPNALDDVHPDLKKAAINIVQTMDTLTQRRISLDNESHILHRGLRVPLPDSTLYKPEKQEWINKVLNSKVGDKLKPKGFLSTTDNFGTARSFAYRPREKETAELVFTIEAKRGLPLSSKMTQYIAEKEVVLPRNGSFTVVGKEIVKKAPDIQSPQVDRSNASPIIHIRLRQDDE